MLRPLILASVALALGQQTPTLSLDLDEEILRTKIGITLTKHSDRTGGHAKICEVFTPASKCALPIARAYDHHDGKIAVQKDYFLVMTTEDGAPAPQWTKKAGINYDLRSEWVVQHSACDRSANCADPIRFTIILRDTKAPVIKKPNLPSTVEAAGKGTVYRFPSTTAKDRYDGARPVTVSPVLMSTAKVGTFPVTYTSSDLAGLFGKGGKNNVATMKLSVKVLTIVAIFGH
jgi:hypothetical protein